MAYKHEHIEASDFREETRRQRYEKKAAGAKVMPVSIATVNFGREANLAYVFRAAACFGASRVHIIGSHPNRDIMNDLSGSTYDYMPKTYYSRPEHFTKHCKENNVRLISFEMPSENYPATPINGYKFDFGRESCIVVGHETIGVPVEILIQSERVYIPMPGVGYCLNTSQAANVALYEAARQFGSLEV